MTNKHFSKILMLFIIIAALFLASCSPEQNKANQVRKVADQIASYTLPQGYTEKFGVDVLGYQIVGLEGQTPNCHIYLLQVTEETNLDIEKLREQASSMDTSRKNDRPREVRVVETRTATIRGQEVQVAVGEGINSEDQPYREVTALFEGRSGPTLVSISSPVDQWNWEQVNSFLASIQ